MLKKAFFAVSLLVGVGLFVFIINKFGGFGKALEAVGSIGWLGVTLFVLTSAGTLIFPAVGWWILMRGEGLRIPLWTVLKANFMGFPINFIAPSMYLGAEPLKTFYIAHVHGEPKRRILATLIVSKFQEIGSLLFLMIVASGVALWKIEFTRRQEILLVSAMAFLLLVFGMTLYAFVGNFKPTVKAINFVAMIFKKGHRRLARLRTRAEEMERLIQAAFTKRWKTFFAAQAMTLLSAVSVLIRPWLYFAFSREILFVGAGDLCAIFIVTNLINMLPHTPGALGVMEGGMVALFRILGLGTDHDATAYQMVGRLADVTLILLGAWLIFHYNLQAMAKRVAKGEEQVLMRDAEEMRQ
jgi:uncharacterized protein (TIRG00374 family)